MVRASPRADRLFPVTKVPTMSVATTSSAPPISVERRLAGLGGRSLTTRPTVSLDWGSKRSATINSPIGRIAVT